jgi:ureidoacrylate peracid hydrolase
MTQEPLPSQGNADVVLIEAQPNPIQIDTARAAVLVIDMQNDFGAKGGMFDRAGIDISMIQRAVAPTARVLTAARQTGIPVVYLKMAFQPDLSDAGPADAPNSLKHHGAIGQPVQAPDGTPSRILIRDTWNTDILPELEPHEGDFVLYKHRFSGFYATDLDATLKQCGAKYLLVAGCTTSVCVESTIRDAMFRNYSCVLLADCTGEPLGSGFPRSNHEASLFVIQTVFGWVSDSEEFLKAVAAPLAAGVAHSCDSGWLLMQSAKPNQGVQTTANSVGSCYWPRLTRWHYVRSIHT